MNNERIDLSQFESEEEWDLTGFDWLAKQADSDYVANAVRQVPDLIAELKRCYEEIDEMKAIVLETYKCVQGSVAPFGWESYLMKRFNLIGEHLGLLKSASE